MWSFPSVEVSSWRLFPSKKVFYDDSPVLHHPLLSSPHDLKTVLAVILSSSPPPRFALSRNREQTQKKHGSYEDSSAWATPYDLFINHIEITLKPHPPRHPCCCATHSRGCPFSAVPLDGFLPSHPLIFFGYMGLSPPLRLRLSVFRLFLLLIVVGAFLRPPILSPPPAIADPPVQQNGPCCVLPFLHPSSPRPFVPRSLALFFWGYVSLSPSRPLFLFLGFVLVFRLPMGFFSPPLCSAVSCPPYVYLCHFFSRLF